MARYIVSPEAAHDLTEIWRYIKDKTSLETADRIEAAIRDRFVLLARTPGAGHWRRDLTEQQVKFFPIYSYLIVYRLKMSPLQVVSILHSHRDVSKILNARL